MNNEKLELATAEATNLLQQLIAIPSLSKEEKPAADHLEVFLRMKEVTVHRKGNNLWCTTSDYKNNLPSILLNSHLDTVPPNSSYTLNPFHPLIKDGKLFGLGSTDAGASLVCLLEAFLANPAQGLYNLVFAATAEEEISGENGISALFADVNFSKLFSHPASFALVGEPTGLQLAVAEKGLMVLDVTVPGIPGHAAREEGENAIYNAIPVIEWFRQYQFEKISPSLGLMKMNVTGISTENTRHNVVPGECRLVVDIRLTEMYTHEEVLDIITSHVPAKIRVRSTRLKPSAISENHPVVMAGKKLGKSTYGSPTLSDQSLIPLPSLKCGPGHSAQSHSADEFILLDDIKQGIKFYINLLQSLEN